MAGGQQTSAVVEEKVAASMVTWLRLGGGVVMSVANIHASRPEIMACASGGPVSNARDGDQV